VKRLVDSDYLSPGEIGAMKQAGVVLKSRVVRSANLVLLTVS